VAVFKGQNAQSFRIFSLEQEAAFVAQEHNTADFFGGDIVVPLFQEGTVHQLVVGAVIQESDLILEFVVIMAAAAGIAAVNIIENAVAVGQVAVSLVKGSALMVGEDHLIDGNTAHRNRLTGLVFQTPADGIHPGCGFSGKSFCFGFHRHQMHVLAGDRNFIDFCPIFQIRVDGGQNIALGIQQGVAVFAVQIGAVTPDHILRAAAQFPAGIGEGSLFGQCRGTGLKPFIQHLVHIFFVEVSFHQCQGTGSTADDAQ